MKGQPNQSMIVAAQVIDLDDPEQLGRVKVQYPHLEGQPSDWARLVTLMAGPDRGVFFRPEIGDEVLVALEHGDIRRPYILGSVWSKVDKPPDSDGSATDNNWRFVKSRSGHIIKLDDTEGAEKVEIIDQSGQHRVVIDSAGDKIQIICQSGDMEITAGAGTLKIEAQTIEVKATNSLSLEAGATLTIKGATVNIN
jgi:uncharacterized protein involved in type VI secretion and phage assembly